MIRVPPRSTLTETLFPDTTRFRSRLQGGAKFPTGGRRGASTRPRASPRALPRFASPSQASEGQQIRSDAGADGWKRHASSQSRSEEHTSELQSLMRISYAVFCLNKKTQNTHEYHSHIKYTHM